MRILLRRILGLFALTLSVSAPAWSQGIAPGEWNATDGAATDWFGFAVCADGDWSASGAPNEDQGGPRAGALYLLDGAGAEHKLIPQDIQSGQRFGSSVDMDGDWMVVGAPAGGAGGTGVGAAYVFEFVTAQDSGQWVQRARLDGQPGHAGDGFGTSVSIRGGRVLVGAPWNDGAGPQAGAGFVFEKQGSSWVLLAELRGPGTGPGDAFGFAVDLGDRWAAIGGYSANSLVFNEGVVCVFDGAAGFGLAARLLAANPTPNSNFGRSVSLFGDRLAVGATYDHPSLPGTGSVSLFGFDGGGWALEQVLTDPQSGTSDAFGFSVCLGQDRLMVGAPRAVSTGEASLWQPFDGQWLPARRYGFAGSQPGDFVGVDVAMAGDRGLVGAMRDQSVGWNGGAVHRLQGSEVGTPDVVSFCGCEQGPACGGTGSAHGCPNSVGSGAVMGIEGSTSASADDLVLTMSGMAPGQFGFFWMGDGATDVALYDGFRCVNARNIGLFRWPVVIADGAGVMRTGPGLVSATQGGPAALLVGASWCFQGIYRDWGGACGTGINLSDAIWVTLRD